MTTDNTQAELRRLYSCIMHDFHDGKDRENMWVREIGLVVNKQIEAVLDRLEDSFMTEIENGRSFSLKLAIESERERLGE